MHKLLTAIAFIEFASAGLAASEPPLDCWSVDKTTVMAGGCVTILLDDVCSNLRGLTLQINDRPPFRLGESGGPLIQRHYAPGGKTKTYLLLFIDIRSPYMMVPHPSKPDTFRYRPLFEESGVVKLALGADGRELGSETITVTPATAEAQQALELIYPLRTAGERPDPKVGRAFGLVMTAESGFGAEKAAETIEVLKEALPIVKLHPDWGEIFEMLVRRAEAEIYVDRYLKQARAHARRHIPASDLPEPPDEIVRAKSSKLSSPFARAVQESISMKLGMRKMLLRHSDKFVVDDE